MNAVDVGVIVAYVLGCTWLGSRLGATGSGAKDGLKSYFLGESDIPAWAVMISIVATETSAVTFLSVPGNTARDGGNMTFLQLALGYILARFVVTYVLLPAYFNREIFTAYEILQHRFGGRTRRAAAIMFLVTRTFASGLRLFLAANVLQLITGWSIAASIGVIGASTLLYTYLGGLKGVIWADVLQFFIYLIAACFAMGILLNEIPGGLGEVIRRGRETGKFVFFDFGTELLSSNDFGGDLLKFLSRPYTFWAGVIGGLVLDTGTHGADQMMVQRYLSARSRRDAGRALIVSGFVIYVQFALFLLLGAGLHALYQIAPPAAGAVTKDREFAYFIINYLPHGLLGLVVAAIFSVTMSTMSGAISASASSAVNDVILPLFPRIPESRLTGLSKGMTAFWGLAQMGVAFLGTRLQNSVIDNALAIASFVMGILLGLFLLGLWTKSVGEKAAFFGMITGILAVSAVKFYTTIAYPWFALIGSSTVYFTAVLYQVVGTRIRAPGIQ